MSFPKGEVRHENLLTAYTDLSALVATMKPDPSARDRVCAASLLSNKARRSWT